MATNKVSKATIEGILIDELGGVAHDVSQSMFELNTSTFSDPKPITETEMGIIITDFINKRTIYKQGGTAAKKPYETAHKRILDCLFLFILYVNKIANGDETILKLSMLPYSDGSNTSVSRIQNGEVPGDLHYVPGAGGTAIISCAFWGTGVKYFAFVVKGFLPAGIFMSIDGQLSLPEGATMPALILNINGKREKKITGLITKTDYQLYYVVVYGGVVSGLSLPLLIGCKN